MAEHVSDSILLERYVSRREEAAFVDLVKRHGPRVEGHLPPPCSATNTTSKTSSRRLFSSWLARRPAYPGGNRWEAGCARSPIGWR